MPLASAMAARGISFCNMPVVEPKMGQERHQGAARRQSYWSSAKVTLTTTL